MGHKYSIDLDQCEMISTYSIRIQAPNCGTPVIAFRLGWCRFGYVRLSQVRPGQVKLHYIKLFASRSLGYCMCGSNFSGSFLTRRLLRDLIYKQVFNGTSRNPTIKFKTFYNIIPISLFETKIYYLRIVLRSRSFQEMSIHHRLTAFVYIR